MKKIALITNLFFAIVLVSQCKHKIPEPNISTTAGATTGVVTSTSTTGGSTTGTLPTNSTTVVNKKDSICYSAEIEPIFSKNCSMSGCHDAESKQKGINLSTYATMYSSLTKKNLLKVLSETDPRKIMPPPTSGTLSTEEKYLLTTWANQEMQNNIDCPETCDTLNLTFSGSIFPIIAPYCISCHNVQAPVFTDYEGFKPLVQNGKIACVLTPNSGCSQMPKGKTPLSKCQLDKIRIWIAAGAVNN